MWARDIVHQWLAIGTHVSVAQTLPPMVISQVMALQAEVVNLWMAVSVQVETFKLWNHARLLLLWSTVEFEYLDCSCPQLYHGKCTK